VKAKHKHERTTDIVSNDGYEQQLLLDAQQGDMDAYEELQRLLEPDIRRYIQRKIYDQYAVDDVIQETFLAFYRNLHRIEPVDNLRPYIFRIARNKSYDDLRKLERTEEISLDDEPVRMHVSFTEAHQVPKPDDMTHWMLLHLEVQQAIEQLPDTQRETLQLFSEEQLSYAEIADIMDVSIGTVKSRLFYAKKNLRGYLRVETLAVLDEEFKDEVRIKPKKSETLSKTETVEVEQHERVPEL
jgi:RNA polymerase sigma-70 factor (ECF subfamily)